VAWHAEQKRDKVLLRIVTRMTTKLFVVNFKIRHGTARLASPAIATQHLIAQAFVELRIEQLACTFRSDSIQDAFPVTWCRNVRLSSPGRNLKNRRADCKRTSGFSFSTFAPARKSAQIISRQ
jgi:hypothetical protein